MYSFERITIDEEVHDHAISGYVKYTGYEIPIMHRLTYYSESSTVKMNGNEHKCPRISKLLPYRNSTVCTLLGQRGGSWFADHGI